MYPPPKTEIKGSVPFINVKKLFIQEFPSDCPPIRLIGVGISGLLDSESIDTVQNPEQEDLFATENDTNQDSNEVKVDNKIDELTDAVNKRFGHSRLARGTGVKHE